jgi:hypothetical protein
MRRLCWVLFALHFHAVGQSRGRGRKGLLTHTLPAQAYLTAWKHASALLAHRLELQGQAGAEGGEEDLDGGALRHEFIPNWSSAEFEAFVGDIAGLLDELWAKGERGAGEEEKLKKVWESVLVVEEGFWPVV